ncbi:hypothetical protein A3709_19295 [Halioglobus sp. HI00S01]|uniref:hypothetical protein n=1 Tax=Halioglobus sp. HI00S01 TaxID=1822214 RepID=UPI0007C3C510|nr:hypothetical protein [Halioglobus sp. HI00S01]KZX57770.1 hypothetical protein A3709_19295 [Halioglobus sp. HI00S01]
MSSHFYDKISSDQLTADEKQALEDIQYEIDRHDLEYADNFRWYQEGDEEGEIAYNEAAESGCCGSFNTTTMINGQKWFIGCNYGH